MDKRHYFTLTQVVDIDEIETISRTFDTSGK